MKTALLLVFFLSTQAAAGFSVKDWCDKRVGELTVKKAANLWVDGCKTLQQDMDAIQKEMDGRTELKDLEAICPLKTGFSNCIVTADIDEDGKPDAHYLVRKKGGKKAYAILVDFGKERKKFEILVPNRNVRVIDRKKFDLARLNSWTDSQIDKHSIEVDSCNLPRDTRPRNTVLLQLTNGSDHSLLKYDDKFHLCQAYD